MIRNSIFALLVMLVSTATLGTQADFAQATNPVSAGTAALA